MKRIPFVLALILLLVSAGLVMADPPGDSPASKLGKRMDGPDLSYLNLASEQLEKIHSLRESHQKETMPLRTDLFNKRAELRLLWMQTNPDPAELRAKQKEIHDLTGQLADKRISFRLALRDILTQEQLVKYLAQKNVRGYGHHRRDKRKNNGRGKGNLCPW